VYSSKQVLLKAAWKCSLPDTHTSVALMYASESPQMQTVTQAALTSKTCMCCSIKAVPPTCAE
jgi:hypothetical protein